MKLLKSVFKSFMSNSSGKIMRFEETLKLG